MLQIVKEIGAYAGIAAFLAAALLALLYFSQARDVRRLRDWAGRAPERAAQAVQPYSPQTAEQARARRARLQAPRLPGQARYVAVIIGGVLVFGAAASYGILQLSGNQREPKASHGSKEPQKQRSEKVASVQPSQITVAVLNGTATPGLAASVGSSLRAAGFKVGNVTNASETGVAKTKVLYAKGRKAEARAVAQQLKVKRGQMLRMDAANAALAGNAKVAVVTGQDRASQAPAAKPRTPPSAAPAPAQQGTGTPPAAAQGAPGAGTTGQVQ